jgi:protein-tyrosine phosphatase
MPYNDYNEIYDGLFQGSQPPKDFPFKEFGFDVLVLCANECQNVDYDNVKIVKVPGLDVLDDENEAFCIWKNAANEIANDIKSGKKVLVTCFAGMNRSGFVSTITLRNLTGMSIVDCINRVKEHRFGSLCNEVFVKKLLEKEIL